MLLWRRAGRPSPRRGCKADYRAGLKTRAERAMPAKAGSSKVTALSRLSGDEPCPERSKGAGTFAPREWVGLVPRSALPPPTTL